jgi:hypothetical protein
VPGSATAASTRAVALTAFCARATAASRSSTTKSRGQELDRGRAEAASDGEAERVGGELDRFAQIVDVDVHPALHLGRRARRRRKKC